MKTVLMIGVVAGMLMVAGPATAGIAAPSGLSAHVQGGSLGAPDYDWWYGCSPTSAGMMMGYYDINGYGGLSYDNLVPGAVAETSNYGNSGAAANQVIASSGHIAAFYRNGYGHAGDDVYRDPGAFNSLADFMGTSQDSTGNTNGSTVFFNYTDGSRLYAWEMPSYGLTDISGMYGLWEYEQYAGYGLGDVTTQNIFNQYVLGYANAVNGFTWEDYMAEIDAGRVVLIHVENHSMLGYGYDAVTGEVLLHDTWTEGEHRMLWGGSYAGRTHFGVTVFEPTGGTPLGVIPVPGALVLAGIGGCLVSRYRRYGAL